MLYKIIIGLCLILFSMIDFSWDYVEGVVHLHQYRLNMTGVLYPVDPSQGDKILYGPLYYLLTSFASTELIYFNGRIVSAISLIIVIYLVTKNTKNQNKLFLLLLIQPAIFYFGLLNRPDTIAASISLIGVLYAKFWVIYLAILIKPTVAIPFLIYLFYVKKKSEIHLKILLILPICVVVLDGIQGFNVFKNLVLGNINSFDFQMSFTLFTELLPYLFIGFILINKQNIKFKKLYQITLIAQSIFIFKEGANLNYFIPLAFVFIVLLTHNYIEKKYVILFIILLVPSIFHRISLINQNVSSFRSFSNIVSESPKRIISSEPGWLIQNDKYPVITDVHMLRQHKFDSDVFCNEYIVMRSNELLSPKTWPENINKVLKKCSFEKKNNGQWTIFKPKGIL